VTNSESSLIAIILGLGVFAIIMAIGWRSVQNRRILRLQGADGKETIIVAGEDDEISSVVTTTETRQTAPASAQTAADADADGVGSGRGGRAESSTE
jgi:hypothetical protein